MIEFLADWRWWLLMLLIAATGYVQDVASHFERMTGLKRLSHLDTYHVLFGRLSWPLFRYGGFIRIVALIAVAILCGWRAAIASLVCALLLCLALWRVTKRNALTMLDVAASPLVADDR